MKFFKDIGGRFHALDSLAFVHLLPVGSVEISDAEALAIPPKPISQARTEKLAQLERAYETAVQQPVAYMGTTFQADSGSQEILTKTLTSLNPAGGVPPGFAWWDTDNNAVPMTLTELNGLAMAMLTQGWTAFQHKQTKKEAARSAQTVDDVNAVEW
jgi:hypothetical protein